jgi:hypothetical protein
MSESTNAVQNPSPVVPTAAPPARRLKWRERHKKFYQGFLPIFGLLIGMMPGAFMLWMVAGPVLNSHKLAPQAILGLGFIAAGILWVGLLLGAIMAYLTLITDKVLADDSKAAHS